MRFWHINMTLLRLRSKKGTLKSPNLYLQFCRLLLRLKVFLKEHNIGISSWFKRWVQWCSSLRVYILVWLPFQDIYDLTRLSRTAQRTWIMFHLIIIIIIIITIITKVTTTEKQNHKSLMKNTAYTGIPWRMCSTFYLAVVHWHRLSTYRGITMLSRSYSLKSSDL